MNELKNNDISGVHCPICESSFSIFNPIGRVKKRDNAHCQGCGSLERHRLIWLYMHEKTNFFTDQDEKKVLHFAPEKVFHGIFSDLSDVDYFPCDLDDYR